ncbi:Sodium-dependent phosphate transporter [Nostoc flagelliforme CCNUN1]|uniref:Sodium-dependent phosphate transporter n=1 Tax=Nostoc flagelliforme CCNUN1 TaxID=2038116 RepID=A0A2K8SSI8_9NOSO|nr:Sodium-dependent phosphate transporter [Nostoc flagelliforme CCNUN1]
MGIPPLLYETLREGRRLAHAALSTGTAKTGAVSPHWLPLIPSPMLWLRCTHKSEKLHLPKIWSSLRWRDKAKFLQSWRTHLLFSRTHLLFSRTHLLFRRTHLLFRRTHLLFRRTHLLFRRTHLLFRRTHLLFRRTHLLFRWTHLL